MRPVRSLYRLQLGPRYPFARARSLLPYLARLGVTHLYLSPVLAARRGSVHGYDWVDPTRVSPALGGERGLRSLVLRAHALGLGLVVDIVPNHMAASLENRWWYDLLRRGPRSRYARHFDIEWEEGSQVVLPWLTRPLEDVIRAHDLSLEGRGGRHTIRIPGGARLPVSPEGEAWLRWRARNREASYGAPSTPREGLTPSQWKTLLGAQWWQLVPFQESPERVNYRRFFDVNDLVGLRVEEPSVFRDVHAKVIPAVRAGWFDGLRIDHVDGLRDPRGYLRRLARSVGGTTGPHGNAPAIYVEKILLGAEELRRDWPVAGTTGYEFLRDLSQLLADPRGARRLTVAYERFLGVRRRWKKILLESRSEVLAELFPAEVRRHARRLRRAAERLAGSPLAPDPLWESILARFVAHFEGYRSYLDGVSPASEEDRRRILTAWRAVRTDLEKEPSAGDVLAHAGKVFATMLRKAPPAEVAEFAMRLQQFLPAVTGKGLEDRALYRFFPVPALNEVGGVPQFPVPGSSTARWHRAMARAARQWPGRMTTTSTHDTKRSEDVRARLLALTEWPGEFAALLPKWNARLWRILGHRPPTLLPDRNAVYLLFTTLLGSWPVDAAPDETYARRIQAYLVKAARERARRSSWHAPDPEFERWVETAVARLWHDDGPGGFLPSFLPFQRTLAWHGALRSLVAVALKGTAPGSPDFYQGCEMWDLSLVDPDNRRPVDFRRRKEALASLLRERWGVGMPPAESWRRHWEDGRIKLWVTHRTLSLRKGAASLAPGSPYHPVRVRGAGERVVAFRRGTGGESVVTVALRETRRFAPTVGGPVGDPEGESLPGLLRLPGSPTEGWTDVLTGKTVGPSPPKGGLPVREILRELPVAILVPSRSIPR